MNRTTTQPSSCIGRAACAAAGCCSPAPSRSAQAIPPSRTPAMKSSSSAASRSPRRWGSHSKSENAKTRAISRWRSTCAARRTKYGSVRIENARDADRAAAALFFTDEDRVFLWLLDFFPPDSAKNAEQQKDLSPPDRDGARFPFPAVVLTAPVTFHYDGFNPATSQPIRAQEVRCAPGDILVRTQWMQPDPDRRTDSLLFIHDGRRTLVEGANWNPRVAGRCEWCEPARLQARQLLECVAAARALRLTKLAEDAEAFSWRRIPMKEAAALSAHATGHRVRRRARPVARRRRRGRYPPGHRGGPGASRPGSAGTLWPEAKKFMDCVNTAAAVRIERAGNSSMPATWPALAGKPRRSRERSRRTRALPTCSAGAMIWTPFRPAAARSMRANCAGPGSWQKQCSRGTRRALRRSRRSSCSMRCAAPQSRGPTGRTVCSTRAMPPRPGRNSPRSCRRFPTIPPQPPRGTGAKSRGRVCGLPGNDLSRGCVPRRFALLTAASTPPPANPLSSARP